MKSFICDLEDLSPSPDTYITVRVFYEDTKVYELLDAQGVRWKLSDLSDRDRNIVEQDLVQNLLADDVFSSPTHGFKWGDDI